MAWSSLFYYSRPLIQSQLSNLLSCTNLFTCQRFLVWGYMKSIQSASNLFLSLAIHENNMLVSVCVKPSFLGCFTYNITAGVFLLHFTFVISVPMIDTWRPVGVRHRLLRHVHHRLGQKQPALRTQPLPTSVFSATATQQQGGTLTTVQTNGRSTGPLPQDNPSFLAVGNAVTQQQSDTTTAA